MYAPIAVIRSTRCHDDTQKIYDDSLIWDLHDANETMRNKLLEAHALIHRLTSRLELLEDRPKLDADYLQLKVRLKRMQDCQIDAERAFDEKLRKERLARLDAELKLSQYKDATKKRAVANRPTSARPGSARVQSFGTDI